MGQSTPIGPSSGKVAGNPRQYRFSTHGLQKDRQFAAWQVMQAPLLDIDLPENRLPGDGYLAEIIAYHLDGLLFAKEKFGAVEFSLRAPRQRKSAVDHWLLCLYKVGQSTIRSQDEIIQATSGSLTIRSLSIPCEGHISDSEILFVVIPRTAFRDAALDGPSGKPLSGGLAKLLGEFLLSTERRLVDAPAETYPVLGANVRSMIEACITQTGDSLEKAKTEIAATLLGRAKRYIRAHIGSKDLSPDELCRELGVSRAQLYRLFEPSGGVAREIREQRLLSSLAALTRTDNHRRIYEIADDFGFKAPDEFGRTFKSYFGFTPLEARHHPRNAISSSRAVRGDDYHGWIRHLGT